MIKENKVSKYFLYAIGEIVLVVIGILIALSINNWNENRKNNNKETAILLNLKTEFETNKEDLIETIGRNSEKYNLVKKILSFTGQPNDSLTKETSDEMIYNMFTGHSADISTGFINDLLNSGNIYLIKSDSLRNQLTNWEKELIDYKIESEDDFKAFYNTIFIPFMMKNYSYEIRARNQLTGLKFNSTFTDDYKSIYKLREFENIVITKLTLLDYVNNGYKSLIAIIDQILLQIEKEIKK